MENSEAKIVSTNPITPQSNNRPSHKFLAFVDTLASKEFNFSNSYQSIYDDIKINKNSLSNIVPTYNELKQNFTSFLHFKKSKNSEPILKYWNKQHLSILLFLIAGKKQWTTIHPDQFLDNHWLELSELLPQTTPESIKYKWLSLRSKSTNFQNFWSLHDDYLLMQVIYEQDPALLNPLLPKPKVKWSLIAMKFNHKCKSNKLGKHCKERWFNHLSPNLNKTIWTDEEDILLLENALIYDKKWAKITHYLPGRTQHNVKNRFLSLIAREHKISCKKLSFKENCCKSMILTTLCRLKKRFNFSKVKPAVDINQLPSSISENLLLSKEESSNPIEPNQDLPITIQVNQELPISIIQLSKINSDSMNIQQISEINQEAIKLQMNLNQEAINQKITQFNQEALNQQISQLNQEAINHQISQLSNEAINQQISQLNQEEINHHISQFNQEAINHQISQLNQETINHQISQLNQEAIKIQQMSHLNHELSIKEINEMGSESMKIQKLAQMKQEAIIMQQMSHIKTETLKLEQMLQINQESSNIISNMSQVQNSLANSPNNNVFQQESFEDAHRNVNYNSESISFNETLGEMYFNLDLKNEEEAPSRLDQMKEIDIFEDNNELFDIKF